MKKIILILFTAAFIYPAFSQASKTDEPVDVASQVEAAKTKSGSQLLDTQKDIRLFAEVVNGSVSKLTAMNKSGKALNVVTSSTVVSGRVKCRACVSDEHGTVCWWINCKDLPRPSGRTSLE